MREGRGAEPPYLGWLGCLLVILVGTVLTAFWRRP